MDPVTSSAGQFGGLKVVTSSLCVQRGQWRFPRSKKRRIRRKWAKVAGNHRDVPASYVLGDVLMCHPQVVNALKAHFAAKQ